MNSVNSVRKCGADADLRRGVMAKADGQGIELGGHVHHVGTHQRPTPACALYISRTPHISPHAPKHTTSLQVPFRLTRMMVKAMEVSGIEGNFRTTCENVMRVLRANKESVTAMLEAFVHDPLINWRLLNTAEAAGEVGAAVGVCEGWKGRGGEDGCRTGDM